MRPKRCERIRTEEWKAPGGTAIDGYPVQVREMQARCVLNEGHLDVFQDHIWGDWLETSVAR